MLTLEQALVLSQIEVGESPYHPVTQASTTAAMLAELAECWQWADEEFHVMRILTERGKERLAHYRKTMGGDTTETFDPSGEPHAR